MPWGVAAAGIGAAGAIASSNAASGASQQASGNQMMMQAAGLALQSDQFDRVRNLLQPYVDAGSEGLQQQRQLAGLEGPGWQQYRTNQIAESPQFTSIVDQGENAMRQNASATGGLRGGNFQAALAQFRPSMLSAAISDQYARLGGMTSIGQNAAAGVGNSGAAMANNSSNLLGQMGSAMAGNALAQGRAQQQGISGLTQGLGTAFGALGNKFGPLFASNPAPGYSGTFQSAPMGETYA